MAHTKILVIDDEESIRDFFQIMLKREGFEVATAVNGKDGLDQLKLGLSVDLVIADIQMPEMSGLEFLSQAKEINPELMVIMITAHGSTETAVEAMKRGAYDYILKPFKLDEIKIIINQALERRALTVENQQLKRELGTKYAFDNIVGASDVMMQIYSLVKRVASTKSSVLITGESGTGKELIARAIHFNGPLKDQPFVTVNCGAIPENLMESEMFGHKKGSFTGAIADKRGLFEVANGGTIFLDEIGELPLNMQVKLLRVIQEGTFKRVGSTEEVRVDVRVVSATNRHLETEVKAGRFREDLFYRMNVIQILCPSLRHRHDDIPMLANHFMEKFCQALHIPIKKISHEAMDLLLQYSFPGNVRELENVIERTVALEAGAVILRESLPPHIQLWNKNSASNVQSNHSPSAVSSQPSTESHVVFDKGTVVDLEKLTADFERKILVRALEHTGGIKKRAARLLNISFRSMRYRVEKYGLNAMSPDDDDLDDVAPMASSKSI